MSLRLATLRPLLPRLARLAAALAAVLATGALAYRPARDDGELPNRIPEAAPYVVDEARFFPPPFDEYWRTVDHPGQCQSCHERIFAEWRGSMMANAWRDPLWRAAFLLSARQTSTDGDCSAPAPPDGSARARHNPFARSDCSSSFDLGTRRHVLARPGSLLDGFCSRCHMPSDYVDNVPLHNVVRDAASGREHGRLERGFDPTSDAGTGIAFAALEERRRNSAAGQSGVSCAICHTIAQTRDTPYHNYPRADPAGREYTPVPGAGARAQLLAPERRDTFAVPDAARTNLGFAIGAGSFRLSPHALGFPERFGPFASQRPLPAEDRYLSGVFGRPLPYQQVDASKHEGFHHVLTRRAELCSACHDVTNPLTIKNRLGRWVGGFPIERTYAEWAGSRYADRPGNPSFDPAFKRDCQTCHMQQDYGQPGTAQTLYEGGRPRPPAEASAASDGPQRPRSSHHFVGGNAYVPRLVGAALDTLGAVEPYPELSIFSFSSADKRSLYSNAYWTGVSRRGPLVQQSRMAWDRLRHVLELTLEAPARVAAGGEARLRIAVTNSGSGHKFPTGFPEGRIAWIAVRAFDLASGRELEIHDSTWNRTSLGVGRLTESEQSDPNYPGCHWKLPAGSPDPYAVQLKAVASLGDGCPTLELVYAHALNLVTNAEGQPIDARGRVIDREAPDGLPQFRDLDRDGDVYDDAFLTDTRLQPLPSPGATLVLDRYAVRVPPGTEGPLAVSAAVYYQSAEAVVAAKLLGNLADGDTDFTLEPCVLGGACDGRVPDSEPAVVEGAPPVPMEVRSRVVHVDGAARRTAPPRIATYPPHGARGVFQDLVVKATFSEPVAGVHAGTFRLTDARGRAVPAAVDQIGDGTWALFPDAVFLAGDETYTAELAAGVCGSEGRCTTRPTSWSFRTAAQRDAGAGDTRVPLGFARDAERARDARPELRAARWEAGGAGLRVAFSEPVMNVTPLTLALRMDLGGSAACAALGLPVPGRVAANAAGDLWTFTPEAALEAGAAYCLTVTSAVYDLAGQPLAPTPPAALPPHPAP